MFFPSIKDFNYELPDSSVAKYPLTERDQSKLLVWDNTNVTDSTFSDLPEFLPESSMLVFNNTRVIRARLHFFKSTGASIEIFCLEPTLPHDYVLSFAHTSSCRWKCIVGNKKRWKEGVLQMCVEVGGEEGLGDWETGRLGEGEDEGMRGRGDDAPQTEGLGDLETRGLGERVDEGTRGRGDDAPQTEGLGDLETRGLGERVDEGTRGRGDDAPQTEGLGYWETRGLGERVDEWTRGRRDESASVPERSGPRAEPRGRGVVLRAEMVGEMEGGFEIEFTWDNPNFTFAEILEAAGNIPIPPYLHRESEEIDLSVYQTVYAKIKGSVAAPTAGLHFTDKVFKALAEKHITCEELTLHVGAGTFQPVKSESVGDHRMHTEYFSVNRSTISKLITHPGSVIAVGTTSVRTLESLYWIGMKIVANPFIEPDSLAVTQWEPYQERGGEGAKGRGGECDLERWRRRNGETEKKEGEWTRGRGDERASVPERSGPRAEWSPSGAEGERGRGVALQAILDWLAQRNLLTLDTATQIMILPGYRFRIISGLVTNFHQPQSTLLLLISAILGDDWKRVYAHALEKGYRFLSYGDANLYLLRHMAETNIK